MEGTRTPWKQRECGLSQGAMSTSAAAEKARIRREVRDRLKQVPDNERKENSTRACALLAQQPDWKRAGAILLYAPAEDELDIWPLAQMGLEQGKRLAIPRYAPATDSYYACQIEDLEGTLSAGRYGIREPGEKCEVTALKQLDLILVPGVAFDLQG